jgi:thiamine-phosphate pyrophosphorylase
MEFVVISNPVAFPGESQMVNNMFAAGLQTFHLRKPNAYLNDIAKFLKSIDQKYLHRIVLHSHHRLAVFYNVGGIHLNEATRLHLRLSEKILLSYLRVIKPHLSISTSIHRLVDLEPIGKDFSSVFLSPVFDSISKHDYRSSFDLSALKQTLSKTKRKIIALGGINSERLQMVEELGFSGAASIGAIWNEPDPVDAFKKMKEQCQHMLHTV